MDATTLPAWFHYHNQHRPRSAIGRVAPISHLSSNMPGRFSWYSTMDCGRSTGSSFANRSYRQAAAG